LNGGDLFDNMSHGVIYASPDGVILSLNKACLGILGVTEAQMLGKSIYEASWKPIHDNKTPINSDENPTKIAIRTKKPVLIKF
jgi:PAS domain S-box-containing protein